MKLPALAVLSALSLTACATDDRAAFVEKGYEPGALGVNAMARADWAKAEELLLERRGVSASDPARLINLGRVYMETGRTEQALAVWRRALASNRHFMVETGTGTVISTEDLARDMIARHATLLETAAR